ncbi:histidine-type phosphatase [Streptomyces sp. NPDC093225]|uniref:histidine-type phosphatase n=1 Tax=Streptomyces sp. NPDC093225 TaxID=3366034 RepID=UPI003824BE0A
MNRTISRGVASAAALLAVATAGSSASAQDLDRPVHAGRPHFYGTKTPYAPQQRPEDLRPAPRGYAPVFAEVVARHGSRAMSDGEDAGAVLALLESAHGTGALTDLGERLLPPVRALNTAAAALGYGNLSGRGAREHREMAGRLHERLPELFEAAVAGHEPIEVRTSGQGRAVASGRSFTDGLTAGDPDLAGLVQAPVTDKNLLYFHKQPQNADYQAYVAGDPDLAAVLARIDADPRTGRTAAHVVSRLFDEEFAAALPAADRVSFARSLHALYSSAPDLADEVPDVDLDPFLTPRDAEWLAYLDDAEEFYEKGPAFRGRTITYGMAGVLLDDLFAQVEAKATGRSDKAVALRFTHAEELIPLAVQLGLPGSTRPAAADEPYSYANNAWRGERVAPMAVNVQWELYARTAPDAAGAPAKAPRYLVRMLYNERATAFKPSCRPVAPGSRFYDLAELERCFGRA